MSTADRATELAAKLEAAGVPTTTDPGSAVPPVVLIPPPSRTFDLAPPACTVTWQLVALAPAPGDLGAWRTLDTLVDAVATPLPVETAAPAAYTLHPDAPANPAYLLTFTEALES
jgi:hypothetical protein